MLDRGKRHAGQSANLTRRRIWNDQVGVFGLKCSEFSCQRVISGIVNFWVVERVIALIVMRDLRAQFAD